MQKNYDFKSVDCIVGGQNAYGFAEGDDAISVEPDQSEWELTVGAGGEATRSKNNNKSGTIKLKLQSTSDFNDVLNGFLQADRLKSSGTFPFMLKDRMGRELFSAESMWVEKAPPSTHGAKVGSREWTLRTDELLSNYGGS